MGVFFSSYFLSFCNKVLILLSLKNKLFLENGMQAFDRKDQEDSTACRLTQGGLHGGAGTLYSEPLREEPPGGAAYLSMSMIAKKSAVPIC